MATHIADSTADLAESFRSALRGGFGRAHRLARELGAEAATELFFEALERNEVPDGPGTADWLLDLAAECRAETLLSRLLATKVAPMAEEVAEAAEDEAPPSRDVTLLARLAGDGDEGARSALYRHFVRRLDDSGTRPIMALDGIEGFLFVVETLGQCVVARSDFLLDLSVYRDACRRLGRERVETRLERRASRSRYAAAFLDAVRQSGAAGADLGFADGPACDLDVIAPTEEEIAAAVSEPANALLEIEGGARRAGLVDVLGRRGHLDDSHLRELLLDAHASVRTVARRYFRGGLELERISELQLTPGGGTRSFSVECFHGGGEAPFEMTEIFAALRADAGWAEGDPARRGNFAADDLDVMHLRPRQARDLRVTLMDWLTDDPFFPVPISDVLVALDAVNEALDPKKRIHMLMAPRPTDESLIWESCSEWWLVDEEARTITLVRFGTPF